jgi:hypothetical protein
MNEFTTVGSLRQRYISLDNIVLEKVLILPHHILAALDLTTNMAGINRSANTFSVTTLCYIFRRLTR